MGHIVLGMALSAAGVVIIASAAGTAGGYIIGGLLSFGSFFIMLRGFRDYFLGDILSELKRINKKAE